MTPMSLSITDFKGWFGDLRWKKVNNIALHLQIFENGFFNTMGWKHIGLFPITNDSEFLSLLQYYITYCIGYNNVIIPYN